MTNVRNTVFYLWLVITLMCFPAVSKAQSDALSLSVTPTLFDISVEPGQVWRSSVRVINPNTRDIVVYAQPVVLSSDNERGVGNFTPVLNSEQQGITLAEWIEITDEPIEIPAQETATVPFTIPVPTEAAPGGQYAAILISTQPQAGEQNVAQIRTTQAVSALFFMRIEGDVIESGSIRSFRTTDQFVQRPENNFKLRFENQGTVHLLPQGDITIFNMWGQQRGIIPVNQRTEFGKVLPDSVREYNFSWTGAYSLLDIGRYRAELTLGYGNENKSFVDQTLYFWVIPIYGLLITLGGILSFVLLITWLVRIYIQHMLRLAGISTHQVPRRSKVNKPAHGPDLDLTTDISTTTTFEKSILPIKMATADIANRWRSSTSISNYFELLYRILWDYRWVVIALIVGGGFLLFFIWFYQIVAVQERSFESRVIDHTDTVTSVITSEDLYLEKLQNNLVSSVIKINDATFGEQEIVGVVELVNVSGKPGAAASLAYAITPYGLTVENINTDLERIEQRSIIVYGPEQLALAKQLSQAMGGALLSVRPETSTVSDSIVVFVGEDVLVD